MFLGDGCSQCLWLVIVSDMRDQPRLADQRQWRVCLAASSAWPAVCGNSFSSTVRDPVFCRIAVSLLSWRQSVALSLGAGCTILQVCAGASFFVVAMVAGVAGASSSRSHL